MTEIKKLKNHPYAQCHVEIIHNGLCGKTSIAFVSYNTTVVEIEYTIKLYPKMGRGVRCSGIYSPTTSRQTTWFLREYAPDLTLADMKKVIGKDFVEL